MDRILATEGRPADAITQYRRAAELAPDNATVHSNLGAAYFLLGDFGNAAAAFRRSVEIAPTGEGYSNTATMYYFDGRYDDAAAMFEEAVKLAPQDQLALGQSGRRLPILERRRKALASATYAKAAELARESLRVNPEDALARAQLAYFLARQGRSSRGRGRAGARGSRGCHCPVRPLLRCAWRTWSSETRMPPFRS